MLAIAPVREFPLPNIGPIVNGLNADVAIQALFANNEQGLWYDPSQLDTMFQDSVGTTPVTGPGDPVGLILDRRLWRGRTYAQMLAAYGSHAAIPGNHASQATSAARPTLARVPYGGRRNLMTRTQELDNAVWNKPTSTVQANATTAPDGTLTADKIVEDGSSSPHGVWSNNPVVTGITYTGSAYLKAAGRNYGMLYANIASGGTGRYFSLPADGSGQVLGQYSANVCAASIEYVGNGWYRCSITWTETATTAGRTLEPYTSINGSSVAYAGDSASGIYAWGLQLEPGSNPTAYQKVTSTHDVTEAGKADCWHLSFDGSDDNLVTGSIDFGACTKLAVLCGHTNEAAAVAQMLLELSSNFNINAGSFYLDTRDAVNGDFGYGLNAGTSSSRVTGAGTTPRTVVNSCLFDVNGATITDRTKPEINGAAPRTTDVSGTAGTGFGNYQLFIGRRNGNSLPFKGLLFGLVLRGANAQIDIGQYAAAKQYMAGKTGVSF